MALRNRCQCRKNQTNLFNRRWNEYGRSFPAFGSNQVTLHAIQHFQMFLQAGRGRKINFLPVMLMTKFKTSQKNMAQATAWFEIHETFWWQLHKGFGLQNYSHKKELTERNNVDSWNCNNWKHRVARLLFVGGSDWVYFLWFLVSQVLTGSKVAIISGFS